MTQSNSKVTKQVERLQARLSELQDASKRLSEENIQLKAAIEELEKKDLACKIVKSRERVGGVSYEEYMQLEKKDLEFLASIYNKLLTKLPSDTIPRSTGDHRPR